MLQVKNISKKFGNTVAADNVEFTLENGKILGLLGKNGAGKSTIFRIILDILKPDSGNVLLNNKEYTLKDSKKIGFLPEEGSLSQELTVYEQLCFYGSLKDMSNDEVLSQLTKWLLKFDIVEYLDKKIKELSKGNRQRIQFVVALLHNPEFIILDEPFSGLDPLGVEKFKEILLELKKENKAIIFSSHRMEHVEMFCDDILFIDKGRTLCYGDLGEIKKKYDKVKVTVNYNTNKVKEEHLINKNELFEYTAKIAKEGMQYKVEDVSLNDIFIDKVGGERDE